MKEESSAEALGGYEWKGATGLLVATRSDFVPRFVMTPTHATQRQHAMEDFESFASYIEHATSALGDSGVALFVGNHDVTAILNYESAVKNGNAEILHTVMLPLERCHSLAVTEQCEGKMVSAKDQQAFIRTLLEVHGERLPGLLAASISSIRVKSQANAEMAVSFTSGGAGESSRKIEITTGGASPAQINEVWPWSGEVFENFGGYERSFNCRLFVESDGNRLALSLMAYGYAEAIRSARHGVAEDLRKRLKLPVYMGSVGELTPLVSQSDISIQKV